MTRAQRGPATRPRSGASRAGARRSTSGTPGSTSGGAGSTSGGPSASSRSARTSRTSRSAPRSRDPRGSAPAPRVPRGTRPARAPRRLVGVPVRTWLVVAVLLAVLGGAAAYLTPVLGVRTVAVTGTSAVPADAVRSALAVGQGTPLLQLDLDAAARRVAAIPEVAAAQVRRDFPSTVTVTVTERRATLAVAQPDGTHLLDATGVDFATGPAPAGVPALLTPTPGSGDDATRAALAVVTALPPGLAAQVTEVRAPTASEVSLALADGRTVVVGSADQAARKGAVAAVLLTQPGQTADVTSPDLPTMK